MVRRGGGCFVLDRQRFDADPDPDPTSYFDAGGSGFGPTLEQGHIIQILCAKQLTHHNLAMKS
jgi:hypothetical protein